jgi:hypothetical protein
MTVKRKVNYTNRYAVIDPVSLTMMMTLLSSILINLTIRSFYPTVSASMIYGHLVKHHEI